MPRRWALVATAATLVAWLAGSSFVYCLGTGHREMFVFPYTQWVEDAFVVDSMRRWGHSYDEWLHHPLIWFSFSGLVCTLIALGLLWQIWSRSRPAETPFGAQEWADEAHMRKHGIRFDRNPL